MNKEEFVKLAIVIIIAIMFAWALLHIDDNKKIFELTPKLVMGGWLSGYAYRKKIPVNYISGGLSNYQMSYNVYSSTGVDSAGTVYLNNHAVTWPNDIRITESDGVTPVNFWRESYDASLQEIWIKVPTIPNSGTTDYYIYYSKAGDSDASNGFNTFLFFDDFDDGDYTNNPTWTPQSGTYTAVNHYLEKLTVDQQANFISTPYTFGSSYVIEFKFSLSSLANYHDISINLLNAADYSTGSGYLFIFDARSGTACDGESCSRVRTHTPPSSDSTLFQTTWTPDTAWHTAKIIRNSSGNYELFLDDVSKGNATDATYTPTYIVAAFYATSPSENLDDIRVRQYVSPEPTWALPGSESTIAGRSFGMIIG